MARSRLEILDSDTTLFLLAPGYHPYYAKRIEVNVISHEDCGIYITIEGPLYDMAMMLNKIKDKFALSIQNHPCGQPDRYSNEQTIILIEGCSLMIKYLDQPVKFYLPEIVSIVMMYADITAEKVTIYDGSGEEISVWHGHC